MLSTDYDMALVEFTRALENFKTARRQLVKLEDEERRKVMDGLVAGFADAAFDEMEDVE